MCFNSKFYIFVFYWNFVTKPYVNINTTLVFYSNFSMLHNRLTEMYDVLLINKLGDHKVWQILCCILSENFDSCRCESFSYTKITLPTYVLYINSLYSFASYMKAVLMWHKRPLQLKLIIKTVLYYVYCVTM